MIDLIGNDGLPMQRLGKQVSIISKITKSDFKAADAQFELMRMRLLRINEWSNLTNLKLSQFQLFEGKEAVNRLARVGDRIRIDIPGPGSSVGQGYDWVRIIHIEDEHFSDQTCCSILVKPSHSPLGRPAWVAHFFSKDASSTFRVTKAGLELSAEVHGRNEHINFKTYSWKDTLRNIVIGGLAKFGLSYPQWQLLTDGLVNVN